MFALGAFFWGRINVFPGGGSTEHVINLLQLGVFPTGDLSRYVMNVRAGVARKTQTFLPFLHDQHITTGRTEQQHDLLWPENNKN